MILVNQRISDYNLKVDFSFYDQITRKSKQYPLQKKITFKYGVLAVTADFDGVMLSNDATYKDPLYFLSINYRRRSLFSLIPLETYAYAIGNTFSIKLSLPASLEGLSFRPHKYYEEEILKDKEKEILLYRSGKLIGKYVIKYYHWQPEYNWHFSTFFEKYQVDEIVFPAEFDFDNILLNFNPIRILEVIKFDYFKQLVNSKREELREKEMEGDKEFLEETANLLVKEMSHHKITVEDMKEVFKDIKMEDEITKELLYKITTRFSMLTN